jgi:ABC-type polysaccharide/polyol phosphate export permease
LRLRYKKSFFGFLWSLADPVITCAMITFAMRKVLSVPIPNYSAYLFAAYLPWIYFQNGVMDSCSSILYNFVYVKKIYFPREVLTLATICSNLIHFFLALGVFFIYWIALNRFHPPLQPTLWVLPFLIVIQTLLMAGVGLILSCLNVYYEDIKFLIQRAMTMLLFITPIFWPLDRFDGLKYQLLQLNPLAALIAAYQKVLLQPLPPIQKGDFEVFYHPLDFGMILWTALVSLLIFAIGCAVFNKMKWDLAEKM